MPIPTQSEYEALIHSLPATYPELAELAPTFPHHRHEPPDIKHNRRPAPGISFTAPNLPALIGDCITLGTNP